jgi:hypothetical protein
MEQRKVCWRVLEGSSSRILTCWMFEVPAAVELRVGYCADTPLHRETAQDSESAQALAAAWLDAVRTNSAKSEGR